MKVGVFDSGLGGLTIVSSIAQSFKDLEIFYIADTLFAPYGEKSFEQVLKHSLDISDYLIKNHKIDALIVACNTATSAAISILREKFPKLIVIGTEPGIKPAMQVTNSKNIGVLATLATLEGEKYQLLLNELSKQYDVKVHERACVGLVNQIEAGKIKDKKTFSMLQKWLEPMKKDRVDTIVLGCTHYPLVGEIIKDIMGAETKLIETGVAIAKRLKQLSSVEESKDKGKVEITIFYTGFIKKDIIDMILETWQDGGMIRVRK